MEEIAVYLYSAGGNYVAGDADERRKIACRPKFSPDLIIGDRRLRRSAKVERAIKLGALK